MGNIMSNNSDDRLIFLILTAQHLLKKRLQEEFRREEVLITPSHTGILFTLEEKGPQSMNSLSEFLFVKNSTVTGLIDRLEKNRLVRRNPVGGDRRSWHISITGKGLEELDKARKIIHRINDEIKEGHPESDLKGMKNVLGAFFSKFS